MSGSSVDLAAILAKGRPPRADAARRNESVSRSAAAQARAKTALTYLHPDDYRSLYLQAKAQIDAERGPLPGDES